MKTVAIIQARMGSTRLPGKVLAEVQGRALLTLMLERVGRAASLDEACVATSTLPEDDPIAALCAKHGVACFRGSLPDVLDRYYHCSLERSAERIVRLTADCPLIDPGVIDEVVGLLGSSGADYVANTAPPPSTFPNGMDVEAFSFTALERAWREAQKPSEREHVTFYLWKSGLFDTRRLDLTPSLAHLRLTVDYPEDLEVIRAVCSALDRDGISFGMREIAVWLSEHPEVRAQNSHFDAEAGWTPALELDKKQGL